MNSLEDMPKDSNYCAGECFEWEESDDGKGRYADLKKRWLERKEA